jgi:hypothetical protein
MPTELQEARLRIRLAPEDADRELDRLERELADRRKRQTEEAGKDGGTDPALVPTPVDDARGGGGSPRDRRAYHGHGDGKATPWTEDVRRKWNTAAAVVGTPPSQHVRDLSFALAGAIPLAGPYAQAGMRGAEFIGRWGTAGAGAARAALPEAARPTFDATVGAGVARVAGGVTRYQSALSALDQTEEQVGAIALTSSMWGGGIDSTQLKGEFANLYRINYALGVGRRARQAIVREQVGEAVMDEVVKRVGEAFTAGGSR